MHKILKSIVKNILQFALFLAVLSVAADYWRRPSAPLDAAAHPLSTLSGSSLTLAQHSSNQTVLLYFWGSWCGICRHTSPVIQKLHEDGVAVLGVAVQSGSDADIRAYLDKQAWHFDNINDAGYADYRAGAAGAGATQHHRLEQLLGIKNAFDVGGVAALGDMLSLKD